MSPPAASGGREAHLPIEAAFAADLLHLWRVNVAPIRPVALVPEPMRAAQQMHRAGHGMAGTSYRTARA